MAGRTTDSTRIAYRVVAFAARLVPADIRRDWTREWNGEIHHHAHRDRRLLIFRSLGALLHASWLRWDRWRLEMLLQDLRYAMRTLLRKPGFTSITVLTLALGIGANAAIFSAVRAVLLRPLPFPDSDRLADISSTTVSAPNRAGGEASPPDFVDWRSSNKSFIDLAAINAGSYAMTGLAAAEQIPGANVTGGFFDVLGVPALFGRTLTSEDDAIAAGDVAVIGYGLWMRRFGGSPHAVGSIVTLDATAYRIVGVMPRGFAYPLESEVWLPQRFNQNDLTTQRGAHYLDVIGRLRSGVSFEHARDDMHTIALRLAQLYPNYDKETRIAIHPLHEALVGDVKPALLLILSAVGFVLLIVCVNVANLILTRALARSREMAIRTALGAARFRLVGVVLGESVVLGIAGGAMGLAFAFWASRGIASLQRALSIPLLEHTRVDPTVVAFTFAISLVAALLFGALPAWHASSFAHVIQRMREDGSNTTADRNRHRMRGLLIVVETSLAVVLLIGAGLLMRSFMRLTSVDVGIDTSNVQTFNIAMPDGSYTQPGQRAAFVESLLDRIERHPAVQSTAAIFGLPLANVRFSITLTALDGRRLTNDEQLRNTAVVRVATAKYFQTLGIPIVQGRAFTAGDRIGSPLAIVVNETAAAKWWPGGALGHELTLGTRMGQGGVNAGGTVVGIARDVHDFGPAVAVRPTVYLSHPQFPVGSVAVVVRGRTITPPIEPLRAIVAELDPDLPIYRIRTLEQIASDAVAQPRVYLLLLGLFAFVAVLLAAIGIYGVLMHAVSQRTREIGIRVALGAKRGAVVAMIVRQAAGLAIVGVAAGLALAAASSGALRSLLFGVQPLDAATYIAVAAGLFAVALVASYVPARRASRIDPMAALRHE